MLSEAYWADKLRYQQLYMYGFVPFLEEAGSMLRAAASLLPVWSIKRREELFGLSVQLNNSANHIRRCGIAWVPNIGVYTSDTASVLSMASTHRYYSSHEKKYELPEEASRLVGITTVFLYDLLPSLKQAQDSFGHQYGFVRQMYIIIETLMEAPYRDDFFRPFMRRDSRYSHIWDDLTKHAMLVECENLAYMQATIEDKYRRLNNIGKGKVKLTLSDDQLQKLADDIGVSPDKLKDAFETEYSSWWNEKNKYRKAADALRDQILTDGGLAVRKMLKEVWITGEPSNDTPLFITRSEVTNTEFVVRTLLYSIQQNISNLQKLLIGDNK